MSDKTKICSKFTIKCFVFEKIGLQICIRFAGDNIRSYNYYQKTVVWVRKLQF